MSNVHGLKTICKYSQETFFFFLQRNVLIVSTGRLFAYDLLCHRYKLTYVRQLWWRRDAKCYAWTYQPKDKQNSFVGMLYERSDIANPCGATDFKGNVKLSRNITNDIHRRS